MTAAGLQMTAITGQRASQAGPPSVELSAPRLPPPPSAPPPNVPMTSMPPPGMYGHPPSNPPYGYPQGSMPPPLPIAARPLREAVAAGDVRRAAVPVGRGPVAAAAAREPAPARSRRWVVIVIAAILASAIGIVLALAI